MTNILFFSIHEFFLGFVYAVFVVMPLQVVMMLLGATPDFDIDITIKVCAVLSFLNLMIVWYSVPLEFVDDEEE
jgi:Sec-independent protein secretion pathway component TatC